MSNSNIPLIDQLRAAGVPEERAAVIILIQPHIDRATTALKGAVDNSMVEICETADIAGISHTDAVASFYGSLLQTVNGVVLKLMTRIARSYVDHDAPEVPKELAELPPLMASVILPTALSNVMTEVFKDAAGDELYNGVLEVMTTEALKREAELKEKSKRHTH